LRSSKQQAGAAPKSAAPAGEEANQIVARILLDHADGRDLAPFLDHQLPGIPEHAVTTCWSPALAYQSFRN
jgi:hypothetical protein